MKRMKTTISHGMALLLLMMTIAVSTVHAQNFRASDLDGNWKRSDGMVLRISGTARFAEGSDAIVMAVGNSGWPQSAAKVAFKFRNLKHNGDNTWTGTNYKHMPVSNYRKEDGKATLVMDEDKQSFRTQGYTYMKE